MWLSLLFSAALTGVPPARGGAAEEAEPVVDVSIENYGFRPNEITLRIGGTVRWTNREKRTSHSVLFPAEGGMESERLFPGERWQRTFSKAGTYPYTCGPHPEMKGRIVVSE